MPCVEAEPGRTRPLLERVSGPLARAGRIHAKFAYSESATFFFSSTIRP